MQTPTILSQAQWIWPCGTLYLLNSYAGFRYDFDMQKLPSEAPFLITADQSYKLHVNGQYVCRGPVRGTQSNWHFDIVDILKFLHTGHNWISIEAFTPGKSTYFYNHKDAAGMLCSANWDNGIQIYSNVNSWQIFRNTAYNSNTAQLSLQMGQMEELDLLSAPEEIELIRHLAKLPNEIVESAKSYDPAKMTRYALDLATLFHKFYNACKVMGDDEKLMQARLSLCLAVRIALKNTLTILKIEAPESM